MPNPLFNKFGNNNASRGGGLLNILNQYKQIQNDPGKILDVLLNNGKINQQQYNELQPMRNDPKQIFTYLSQHGNANQLNQAQQMASAFGN